MIYTLDQGRFNSALINAETKDLEEILRHYRGEYEFLGHNYFGLPMFYFENEPPNDNARGITWIPIVKDC